MIQIWDKYKIIKENKEEILYALKMAYDNIDTNIVNKIWEISYIGDIYKNKDLSYFNLWDVLFNYECDWYIIALWLNEVQKVKEKPKYIKNNLQLFE